MEQVSAIIADGRAFGEYLSGLVALRYDSVWHCLPACAVGAPIQRDRVWIISKSNEVDGQTRVGPEQIRKSPIQSYNPRERIPFWLQATRQFIGVDNGFPDQFYNDRVSAVGNAVCPQIPQIIGEAINAIEGLAA
jgi:DNA (cytosine-5)-methyltransferase 1